MQTRPDDPTDKFQRGSRQKCLEIFVLAHLGSIYFQRELFEKLKNIMIVSKPTGLNNGSKNNKNFIDPPYHLDPFPTAYLLQRPELQQKLVVKLVFSDDSHRQQLQNLWKAEEYLIFSHFTVKFYLIDAHKFGGLFLAYEQDYEKAHAKYLIFKGPLNQNHMSRLAAGCKKEGLVAQLTSQNEVTVAQIQRIDDKKRERPSKKKWSGDEDDPVVKKLKREQ